MKNKVLIAVPYIMGLSYLAYCLFNIDDWVKSHLEIDFFVILPLAVAILASITMIIMRFFFKKKCDYYLTVFFVFIGLIIDIVGPRIPCCSGG